MSPNQARIKLYVDVFEEVNQLANAASDLRPPALIAAILEEFHGQEHLGDNADAYALINKETGRPLDDTASLGLQLNDLDRLALVERELPLPDGATRPSRPIYLRELRAPRAFEIQWVPAIVGRHSEHQPYNELVAVDLRDYSSGLRVSRRHVCLSEDEGTFYIENLSNNPVSLVTSGQPAPVCVGAERVPLAAGDIIRLDRSEIELKFIVRTPPARELAAEVAAAAETAEDEPEVEAIVEASAETEQTAGAADED